MRQGWPPAPGKLRFFTGAAAFAMLAGAGATDAQAQSFDRFRLSAPTKGACQNALCQEIAPLATVTPEGPAGDDGLGPEGIYLEADVVTDQRGVRVATGNVEARYGGRTVRAREVVYDTNTRVVTARGDTQIINPDGSVQFADEVQLDDDLAAGVALGFATRLPNPRGQPGTTKLAAASAVRRSRAVTELNRAIYTPCNLCADNGTSKTPTFTVQAERVTQNRDLQVVAFRDATLRIGDVPVFYTPFFAVPDPLAVRASGFLTPEVNISDRRGFSYEQPYLYVISPSQDVILSPQINTKVNPFLNVEYRKRFYSGELEARFGYTYERDFNDEGKLDGQDVTGDGLPDTSDLTHRSYLLARGLFNFTPEWRWGFSAERTSDDLLFDKYGIDDVYETRGLYEPDNRRLLSQLYTVRQTARSYLSIAALSFQGLRQGDDDGEFPLVAPLIEARYEPDGPVLGGRLRAFGSAAVLERSEVATVQGVDREDSRRATAEVDWRRSFTLPSGVRVEPFALARADAYSVSNLVSGETESKTRGFATAGVDISYPLYRPLGSGSVVIEPLAQLIASNESDRDALIPNEDSISFEFDETNLFEPNKFPGFDRFEGGLRLNAGFRATYDLSGGRGGSVLIGRSFRTEEDTVFPTRVGLREKASDWIVATQINPGYGLSFFNRARLDSDTLEIARSETRFSYASQRVFFAIAHLLDEDDINALNQTDRRREDLDFFAEARITKRIGVLGRGSADLANKEPGLSNFRRRDFGVFYQDECLRFEVIYEREETRNRTLGPSSNIAVRLILATLGDTTERGQNER